jgi:hypothetical protein
MNTRPVLKKGFHWFGSALAIVGVVFVGMHLHEFWAEIDVARLDTQMWSGVAVFSLVYGVANLLLASAWWNLLDQFGVSVSRRWAIKTYGITQLAKYAPGNIFHLAGRQAMGMSAGFPGWPLAKSAVWELGLISVAGGMFSILALPRVLPMFTVTWATLVFICSVGTITLAVWRYCGKPAAIAFGKYCGFLAVTGFLFSGLICLLVNDMDRLPWIELGGAYILAWLVGLVTPGAPAGAGVRELALLFLLNGVVSEADLLLAVVLGRVITVVGDLGFFTFSSLLRRSASAVS